MGEKTGFGPINYILYLTNRKTKLVSQILEFDTIKQPAFEYCTVSFFKNPLVYQVFQLAAANIAVLDSVTPV